MPPVKPVKKKPKVTKAVKSYVDSKLKWQGEMKEVASNFATFSLNNNLGTYLTLNGPTASLFQLGNQYNQRIGDQYDIYGYEIRLQARIANLVTSVAESIRMLIYREKDPEGVQTATAELLSNSGAGISIFSPLRDSMRKRFELFMDKTITLNNNSLTAAAATGGHKQNIVIRKKFKRPKRSVMYPNTATQGIGAIQKGSLITWLVTEGANVDVSCFSFRILYKDA